MSTDDQSPLGDVNALRALLLGEDDAALRSVGELTARVGTVEDLLREDPVTVAKLQSLLSAVLDGLEGPERRQVQDRLMALMLLNIQKEINAAKPGFIQAIYPVAGGLVRKGIQQAIAELLEQIEERLSEPVNIYKRLQIRFQALITGKPEAEIWLRQTGLFHVDRILLVDRATGTVMTGLRQGRDGTVTDTINTADAVQGEDQIVSGMLTAIMSFSREAFGEGGGDGDELSTLEFENSQLHLKATPQLLLVVRTIGTPPAKIDSIIENRFDRMVTDNAEALSGFDGAMDSGSRLEVQAQIRRLLRELRRAEPDGGQIGLKASRKRPLLAFVVGLAGVLLIALLILVSINAIRTGAAVARVQRSVDALPALQAYPLSAAYDREQASIVVRGLVPDAASAGLVETDVRLNHPRLAIDFVLSNIATDAVHPNLRGPRIERETNSMTVNQLREQAQSRDTQIVDLERQVQDLKAALVGRQAVSAASSYPALTYDLDPDLGTLRDQAGRALTETLEAQKTGQGATEATLTEGPAPVPDPVPAPVPAETLLSQEEAIASTVMGFTASGAFTDVERALEAAQQLAALLADKDPDARLEILAVTRPVVGRTMPHSLGAFIASKARALVMAQGIDPSAIRIRTGARAASVSTIDPSTWRTSHYVGFRLAY